jgi:hypothetical protein
VKPLRVLSVFLLVISLVLLSGCKYGGLLGSSDDDEQVDERNPCPTNLLLTPLGGTADTLIFSDVTTRSLSPDVPDNVRLEDLTPTSDTVLLDANNNPIPGVFERGDQKQWLFRPDNPEQLNNIAEDATFSLSTAGCVIRVSYGSTPLVFQSGPPDVQSEQDELLEIPCPPGHVLAALSPENHLVLVDSETTFLTSEIAPPGNAKLLDANKNPIPGAFEDPMGSFFWSFTPTDINQLDDGSPKPKTLWISIGPCLVEVKFVPNPALQPQDDLGDVFQHTDPSKTAENAQDYDDIWSVTAWYNGYPLNDETSGLFANNFSGDNNPYMMQSFQGAGWESQHGDNWYTLKNGMPVGERVRKYTVGPTPQQLEIEKVMDMLLFFSGGNLPTVSSNSQAMPVLAKPSLPSLASQRDGFQFFAPGDWTVQPVTVSGENFIIQFKGAWSGLAVDTATGELGVWTSTGQVEINGNGKTVTLQGPADGETLALSVIAADGSPSDPQSITPLELGERFGVYTAAISGMLTFEAWVAGPFEPFPPDVDTLGWQILLDLDGDPATGRLGDFLVAQGMGFEVFFHSEGFTMCLGYTASGERFDCPADLFTLAYDPAGRVVMSAKIAELQAFAEQAGVKFDPAALRWRFSHINHAIEENPQDVFPNP